MFGVLHVELFSAAHMVILKVLVRCKDKGARIPDMQPLSRGL